MSLKGIRKSDGTAEYIYTDDTLSEENAPGEAKAAGDRIAGAEGRITALETAAPEIISNATKDWLDDNVTPTGSAVAIDSSLTQSGLAADAKAAGDAVNDLKSDLAYTYPNIGYVTKFNSYQYAAGVYVRWKSENQLEIYGTASGWAKFNIFRGNNEFISGNITPTANLPAGTYTLIHNGVIIPLVGTTQNNSQYWLSGETKTFNEDVCLWCRVPSSTKVFGTSDDPSVFEFALYNGSSDITYITPVGITANDAIARHDIDNIEAVIADNDINTVVNADIDTTMPYNIIPSDCVFTEDTYIKYTDGTVGTSSTGSASSDYIEIDPSQEYLCHILKVRIIGVDGIRNGNIPIDDDVKNCFAFYDNDKNYIPYTGQDAASVSKIIPTNAKYFRFTLNAANLIPYAMLAYGNYSVAPSFAFTHYRHDIKQQQTYAATGLENLKMVMFGDSITHGDLGLTDDGLSYINYANNYLRSNIINCGLGGSRMSQGVPTGVGLGSFASLCENIVSDDANAWDALDAYIAPTDAANHDWFVHVEKLKAMDWNTVQAVGLLYGANDWANNVSLGTEYNENPLTYDGACAYGLKKLLTKYPHLQVIIFTPFYREITGKTADEGNANGDTLFDYGKSLENNVRPVLHCPVVDSGNEVGMNRYNITLYASDGTHPRTNLGQYRLGRYFAESIKRYVQPF